MIPAPIRDAMRTAYSHGPMHRRRLARRYDRLAVVGGMAGFLCCWLLIAAAMWAAGGAR